jgi:NADH-quinone oxidoreductase subunit L
MFRSYYMTFSGEYRGNDIPLVDPYPSDTARAKRLFVPEPVRGPTPEMVHALAQHGHGAHHASEVAHGHDPHGGHPPEDAHGHGHDDHHDAHDDHGHGHHGGTPHESPWTMTVPLWVLGIASLFIGVIVGFPPVVASLFHLDIHPALELWLEPALRFGMATAAEYDRVRPNVGFLADEGARHAREYALAGMSVFVAFAGWLSARWLYKDNANPWPERLLSRAPSDPVRVIHRIIYNKYFVDEVYYTIFVRGMAHVWNGLRNFDVYVVDGIVNAVGFIGKVFGFIQGAIDKYLVDGAVNLLADVIMAAGERLRRLQTGQIRNYLLGAFSGAIAAFLLLIAFGS